MYEKEKKNEKKRHIQCFVGVYVIFLEEKGVRKKK
jgi:hypothetical protein